MALKKTKEESQNIYRSVLLREIAFTIQVNGQLLDESCHDDKGFYIVANGFTDFRWHAFKDERKVKSNKLKRSIK